MSEEQGTYTAVEMEPGEGGVDTRAEGSESHSTDVPTDGRCPRSRQLSFFYFFYSTIYTQYLLVYMQSVCIYAIIDP